MSTIFLDRDGVINENRPDYVKSWSEFHFLPGSREAIARLTQAGHRIVVCTNQAGVARGSMSIETVHEIHHRMVDSISEMGGRIEKVYFCPHGKEEDCACRNHEVNEPFRICIDLMNATELILQGLHIPSEKLSSLEHPGIRSSV